MNLPRLATTITGMCLAFLPATDAAAQVPLGTSFTFQGELRLQNVVVNTPTDLVFLLYDQAAAGALLGTNNRPNTAVSRGVFTVDLDFGAAAFSGDARWVEIRLRNPAGSGAYVTLSPRVELKATPNALFARAIGANSVTSSRIVDGSIAAADLSSNSINSAKIADGTVTNADLATGSVDSAKILNGSVTAADIGPSIVSAVDGVLNDGGNIDLVAGTNMTITPNDAANTITFSASTNAGTLDGLDSSAFLRSNATDSFTAGTLTTSVGTTLNVDGNLDVGGAVTLANGTNLVVAGSPAQMVISGANLELELGDSSVDTIRSIGDFEAATGTVYLRPGGPEGDSEIYFFNSGSSTGEALQFDDSDDRLEWTDDLLVTGVLTANGPTATTTVAYNRIGTYRTPVAGQIAGANDLMVSEDLELGGNLYLQGPTIEFDVDGDVNSIVWQETATAALTGCTGTTGAIQSAFEWDVTDNSSSGWAFKNGTDVEFVVDDIGSLGIDGALNTAGGCDLAETFLGPDDLEAGTVVRADAGAAEAVVAADTAYDAALVGVVSTRPALVMNGPTRDADPIVRRLAEVKEELRLHPGDPARSALKDDLERALDTWVRGNVAVALVGRVPVKVTGPVSAGDPLTSSDVRGHAMAMDRPGPSLGIALEARSGSGNGVVMALVQPGWRSPVAVEDDAVSRALAVDDAATTTSDVPIQDAIDGLVTRLDSLERAAGLDGADGRDGEEGVVREVVGDGDDGRDGETAVRSAPVAGAGDETWADYDGDTLVDVAVLDADGRLTLKRNLGDGSFLDTTGVLHHDPTTALVELEWTDYDGDRRPDLRALAADGALVLHHNLGNGTFEAVPLRPAAPGRVAAPDRVADLEAKVERLTRLVEGLAADRAESNR